MSKSSRNAIGVTIGDPCGIGPEVTSKALKSLPSNASCVVIGSQSVFERYHFPKKKNISYVHVSSKAERFSPGKPDFESARKSLEYLEVATDLVRQGQIGALVTAPVSKENIIHWQPKFQGHTEYLADAFGVKKFEMLFVAPTMRVVIVTRHVPLKDVPALITQKKVFDTIATVNAGLKWQFKISHPCIVVSGLNPHAGEGGHLGIEEIEEIIPAIKMAQKKGIDVNGPLAADTLFLPEKIKRYDCVIAMYHDQGLTPIKQNHFQTVVNFTLGLPFIRTSPAHGTGFDIAGKNKADASSMKSAIALAQKLL